MGPRSHNVVSESSLACCRSLLRYGRAAAAAHHEPGAPTSGATHDNPFPPLEIEGLCERLLTRRAVVCAAGARRLPGEAEGVLVGRPLMGALLLQDRRRAAGAAPLRRPGERRCTRRSAVLRQRARAPATARHPPPAARPRLLADLPRARRPAPTRRRRWARCRWPRAPSRSCRTRAAAGRSASRWPRRSRQPEAPWSGMSGGCGR